jgi:hypothetical protein
MNNPMVMTMCQCARHIARIKNRMAGLECQQAFAGVEIKDKAFPELEMVLG